MGAFNEYPLKDGYIEHKEIKNVDIPFSKEELLNISSWFTIAKNSGMIYSNESLETFYKIHKYIREKFN